MLTGQADENMIDVHCHILPLVDEGASSWVVTPSKREETPRKFHCYCPTA